MAQLRDAHTSEIAVEGSAEQVALAAEQFAPGEVTFDDVGEGFDATVVVTAYRDRVSGLDAAATDAEGDDATRLRAAHDQAVAVEAEEVPVLVAAAEQAITEARSRLDT